MKIVKMLRFSLIGSFITGLVGFIVATQTTPIFESVSEVLILRTKLETPFKVQEESRNRWIWLRDGLSLQQNILDEGLAEEIQKQLKTKQKDVFDLASLRKKVTISYTGADEFLFKIKVTDENKEQALQINELVFARLEELYLEEPVQVFENSLEAYTKEYPASLRDKNYEANIAQLKALHGWEQAQRQASFQVLLSPMVTRDPVWPKKSALLITGLLLGFFLGLLIDILILNAKKRV